jgi:hypothetical protein
MPRQSGETARAQRCPNGGATGCVARYYRFPGGYVFGVAEAAANLTAASVTSRPQA